MNPQWRERFARLAMRLSELDASLSDPGVLSNIGRWRQLSREHSDATQVLGLFHRYEQRERDEAAARALLDDDSARGDAELQAMAQEEINDAQAEREQLVEALQTALLPRDPDDDRPALIEIRAGTGGDESALFAGDLARMYLRHAEQQGWQTEILSQNAADLGGYKEIILRLAGDRVYGLLKFESGGHRVQRVPVTESQGRIHTSACTVAVLPEPDEATEITLNPAELRIDTFRASGAGGQHINKTDSAIRITHLPTGLVAECQDDRSQHRNKAKALVVLQARLNDRERQARQTREAAARKSLIGTGDRSDRIRTYNFPQGRLTDHRINLTLYRLAAILDGDLTEVCAALQQAQAQEQLAQLEAGA